MMRDGVWDRKPQKMNYAHGVQKGMKVVLEERGVNTHGMNADRMREVLSSHADYGNEKSRIECFLMENKEHIVYMLPKFHCELNPMSVCGLKLSATRRRTVIILFEGSATRFIQRWTQSLSKMCKIILERLDITRLHI